MDSVRSQYEKFPYPPVSTLALPGRRQGVGLSFERGLLFCERHADVGTKHPSHLYGGTHQGIRILVAGGGTLEPLLVARAHPLASEVMAVDISRRSRTLLERRIKFARLAETVQGRRFVSSRSMAPVRCVAANVEDWEDGCFDYILASNVIHHVAHPDALLKRLASWLRPGGVFRLVTYPKHSRFWINQTGQWLKLNGISQASHGIPRRVKALMRTLPKGHPLRSCFAAHSERRTATGIVDAFLHVLENPLSPLDWETSALTSGLVLTGESQHPLSRSVFLTELLPQTAVLSPWQKLQILDDVLELATNLVLWFTKSEASGSPVPLTAEINSGEPPRKTSRGNIDAERLIAQKGVTACGPFAGKLYDVTLPSRPFWELGRRLHSADRLLQTVGTDVSRLIDSLREEVGPRVDPRSGEERFPGLTIGEYVLSDLLNASAPWSDSDWHELQVALGAAWALYHGDLRLPGASLTEQAAWAQLRFCATAPQIQLTLRRTAL